MLGARCGVVAVAMMARGSSATAQSASKPSFEVVTIRPSVPGRPQAQRVLPTRIDFVNTPLRTVFFTAFRLKDVTEASIPAWTMDVRFDIQATYPSGVTVAQVPEMLQTLLKERFGL